MTARLAEMVSDYLRVRRSLGFTLAGTEYLLTGYLAYLDDLGTDAVTIDNAVGIATAPQGASPRWQALRLSAVRGFARWARTLDPATGPAGETHVLVFVFAVLLLLAVPVLLAILLGKRAEEVLPRVRDG